MIKKLSSHLRKNPLYILLPVFALSIGSVTYTAGKENILSSGKGSYIPDLVCSIWADDERSVEDMKVDFEECLTLHKNYKENK